MATLYERIRTSVLGLDPKLPARVTSQLASPFAPTDDQLQAIVWSEVLGEAYAPTTRAMAMGVPAFARARHLLCGTVARMPLVQLTGGTPDPVQPTWTQRTDGDLSPWHRMLWTVDDLLHYGWSLWAAQRGAPSDGSPLLNAARVPWHRWRFDPANGQLLVDQLPVQAAQAILIPGPHAGVIEDASVSIRMAADNLRAAANAARNPVPNIDLHYTGDEQLSEEQIDAYIDRWTTKRLSSTGGVGWTNKWIEARAMGSHDANLLTLGRNADAVDMARVASVPASLVDAESGDPLHYSTDGSRNQQLLDYGVQLYTDAIAARLSQDDVCTRGKRTAFDTSELTTLTPQPTGAPVND